MFEEKYKKMMTEISPSEGLRERILLEEREAAYWRRQKKRQRWESRLGRAVKFSAGFCAACLIMLLSLPVIAGGIPGAYQLLYRISPKTAWLFKPVQESCEKNGIRMEVISACAYDNTAEIYIAMEDMESDRIDATIDLYQSYSIYKSFSSVGGCQLAEYEEETGRALFLITLTQIEGQRIDGEKITFGVGRFVSRQREYTDVWIPADLDAADRNPEFVSKWINGRTYGSGWTEDMEVIPHDDIRVLPPAEENAGTVIVAEEADGRKVPLEGMELTGIAYADGRLHVQMRTADMFRNDNHGFLRLVDENGQETDYVYHVSYQEQEEDSITRYDEFVFAVAEEELADLNLSAHLWVTGNYTEGPWEVTFQLKGE